MRTRKLPLMEKRILFERTRALWPEAVCHVDETGTCYALSNIYRRLNEQLGSHADGWMQLATWAFHQAVSELALIKPPAPQAALRRHEVSFESFDWWMRMNLSDNSWVDARAKYVAVLG